MHVTEHRLAKFAGSHLGQRMFVFQFVLHMLGQRCRIADVDYTKGLIGFANL
ncbi:hypothetical protein D3C75_1334380 [compost metagenome]